MTVCDCVSRYLQLVKLSETNSYTVLWVTEPRSRLGTKPQLGALLGRCRGFAFGNFPEARECHLR